MLVNQIFILNKIDLNSVDCSFEWHPKRKRIQFGCIFSVYYLWPGHLRTVLKNYFLFGKVCFTIKFFEFKTYRRDRSRSFEVLLRLNCMLASYSFKSRKRTQFTTLLRIAIVLLCNIYNLLGFVLMVCLFLLP